MSSQAQPNGITKLALPVYFELLAGVVAGILDTFWVGKLGGDSVAAVAVATNLENVLLAVILMVSAGTTILISKNMGENNLSAVKSFVKASWILWGIFSVVVACVGFIFRTDIARLFIESNETNTITLTASFLAISFPGVLVYYGQNISDSIFKGNRNTKFPMRMAMLSNLLILVLDPLFIYGLVGLPKMGVQGAALATVLSRVITLIVALTALRRSELIQKVKPIQYGLSVGKAIKEVLALSIPVSGDFLARMVCSMVLIGLIGSFGVASLAAYGIGTKIIVFATMFFYAIRQAASIHTAHTIGLGRKEDIPAVGKKSLLIGFGVAIGFGIVFYLLAPVLVQIFTTTADVIEQGTVYMHYMCFFLIPLSVAVGLGGLFLGAGRSKLIFYVTMLGTLLNVVFAYWFSSFQALQVNGVWLAQIIGSVVQAVILLYIFVKEMVLNKPQSLGVKVGS